MRTSSKKSKKWKNNQRQFWYGFIPGLFIPFLFLWIYLKTFAPFETTFIETIKLLFPSIMMGKLLLLSIIPNLLGVFIFYKQDIFKIGIGIIVGAMPHLLMAVYMM